MNEYLAAFDADFIGGTGGAEQVAEVTRRYGVFVARKQADPGYSLAHSSGVFLIDRAGNLRALMPYGRGADDYVHDIQILLEN
jgi:protein SCO1/2